MLIFKNFKYLFRGRNSNNKKEKDNLRKEKLNDEESMSLISELEKSSIVTSTKGILTNSMITLSFLPTIYLILSVMIIIVLLFLKNQDDKIRKVNNIENFKDNLSFFKIPNFYELPKINGTIFHIYTCITSICGLAIVIILFSVLKQRFKVPEYRDHTFKLYIMMFFGFISNFLNFAKGFSPYFENINIQTIAKEIKAEIKIDLSHLLFIGLIFFSILFSIYSISVLELLRTKQTTQAIQTNSSIISNEDNWFNYKIVILVYLCLFTFIYVMFLLYDNKIFLFNANGTLQIYIEKHLNFVITTFPYFIHIINAVLMFSFYFELRYVNLALSQNLEVDYLFEDSEKHIF